MDIKGYTYGYKSKRKSLVTEDAKHSRQLLIETGINWVCLAFSIKIKNYHSTEILFDFANDPTDLEILKVIKEFHEKGIKVCLKPMIDCKDGMWRALVNFPDESMFGQDPYWKAWFDSYTAYMTYYAELAEYAGCEMLCIGCEMLGTERKDEYWRRLIAETRKVYSGKLVYNTNHGKEDRITWVDALDYLGTSAYYPVAKVPGDSLENMTREWEKIAAHLGTLSEKIGKKIIFMEIGCRSAKGCAMMPWDFIHGEFPADEDEQANFFESCLTVMHDKPWFEGFFWWDWSVNIYDTKEEAQKDADFHIHLKKAEEVLKEWYNKI